MGTLRSTSALVVLLAALPSLAREVIVEPVPGRTPIADALKAAADGDVIRLRKGVYAEHVAITKRVSLVGDEGATLDPSQPFKPEWAPAPEMGPGVYRAPSARRPHVLFLGDRIVAELEPRRAGEEGDWAWKRVLARGGPKSGLRYIRAVWVWRDAEKALYVHLADGAEPRPLTWRATFAREPVLAFRDADGASARGLTLAGGSVAVTFDRARNCSLAGCTIASFDRTGVLLTGGSSGCTVEDNAITRGAVEDWRPLQDDRDRYEVWRVHKLAGLTDRIGVNLFRAGGGNRILRNTIRLTFDGVCLGDYTVEALDKPLPSPEDGKGTEIAGNLIEDTRDSGIELGGGAIDVRVHHNVLRRTHGGLRMKLPRLGPIFIYRNVLEGGAPFNVWFSMDDSPAEAYVYHNTIVGGQAGLIYSVEKRRGDGVPRWHFVNNLVVAERGFWRAWRADAPTNFTAAHNVVVGGGRPWPQDATRDQGSRYVEKVELGEKLRPAPGSPAIDAGMDLSTYRAGKPLPGCEPGAFKGKAPDAGAVEVE